MKKLLNQIEKSEQNNPLLTAALQEIEQLKDKLDQCRMIVFHDMAHYNEEEDTLETVHPDEQSDYKVNSLKAVFINN